MKFKPNKNIYVAYRGIYQSSIMNKSFGPQTRPWKGLKGKTESGLKLEDKKITDDDIERGNGISLYAFQPRS